MQGFTLVCSVPHCSACEYLNNEQTIPDVSVSVLFMLFTQLGPSEVTKLIPPHSITVNILGNKVLPAHLTYLGMSEYPAREAV
jgi:hypothetical protein